MQRKTKIIATLGPASSTEDMIRRLAVAGVDIFRLNFSHGSHEIHKNSAKLIRKIEKELDRPIKIMMDLQGPKIRIGTFQNDSILLKNGDKFILDLNQDNGNKNRVMLPHPEIFDVLVTGAKLLLDDGKISLKVIENTGKTLITEVIDGGILSSKKGVNIPDSIIPISSLTEKDKKDIAIADEIDANWVAISFVQTANDMKFARTLVSSNVKLLAKIEKPSAVHDIDAIMEESDAIMVARGDLGVEVPFEKVPGIQKMLIDKAIANNKPVAVATQMLESMISCHIPTRAEVSDIAFAVSEGASAVMLSAESASGKFPVEAVKTMAKVIVQAEIDNIKIF